MQCYIHFSRLPISQDNVNYFHIRIPLLLYSKKCKNNNILQLRKYF